MSMILYSSMDYPSSWTESWSIALAATQKAVHSPIRIGLTSQEFADLAQVHPNTVIKYARYGAEKFAAKFGSGCRFERCGQAWSFTFSGTIRPAAHIPPIPGLIDSNEFCQIHGIKDITHMNYLTVRGHRWFRARFPGWEFLEIPRYENTPNRGTNTIRWYGQIEILEKQPEDELPYDNLNAHQFSQYQNISRHILKKACQKNDLEAFQSQFPGWSFEKREKGYHFFRSGVEELTLKSFSVRFDISQEKVCALIQAETFSNAYLDWQVVSVPNPQAQRPHYFFRRLVPDANAAEQLKEPCDLSGDSSSELEIKAISGKVSEVSDDWQQALIQARLQIKQLHENLTCPQFARLVGASKEHVLRIAEQGAIAFTAEYGEGCAVVKIPTPNMRWPFRRRYRFWGYVHPAVAAASLGVSLLSEVEFLKQFGQTAQQLATVLETESFADVFPAWGFLEMMDLRTLQPVRVYGSEVELEVVRQACGRRPSL